VSDVAALILWFGVTAYALFGGADFGAGFWDLTAGGAARGRRPRELIDRTLTPVWEANHVWLIFCLVVLWTAFPRAFAAIMATLYLPLTVAALGIVVRGAGFAFGKVSLRLSGRRTFGAAFAASSVITPFFLGTVAGAIASGRVPARDTGGDPISSWVNPTSMLGGVLAVVTCAYLAAVFLVIEGRRRGEPDLEDYFRRRAIGAALVAGAAALAGIFVLRDDSTRLFHRLTGVALPLVVMSAVLGLGALALLLRGPLRPARALAAGADATVVGGWGVAQYPFTLGTHLTLWAAAAPSATLAWVLGIFLAAGVVILPSLVLLYVLAYRGRLEGGAR
jgi:cytochrome d ubiquinol oxidase subunit II